MLRKISCISIFAALFAWSGLCYATPDSTHEQTLDLAIKAYHVHYQESIPDGEYGSMTGFSISYKNRDVKTNTFWRARYELTNHDDHYSGATWGGTPLESTTGNRYQTTEVIYGEPFSAKTSAWIYSGVGFHNWTRDLKGPGGYREDYSWGYIPVGYRREFKINDQWSGGVDASVKFMFGGSLSTPAFQTKVDLGNKPGFRLELPFSCKLSSHWSLLASPWYEYSAIGASNWTYSPVLDTDVMEPHSVNHKYGVDIGASYKF